MTQKVRLNIQIPPSVRRLLKIQSAVQGKTMTALVTELILSHLNPGSNPASHVAFPDDD